MGDNEKTSKQETIEELLKLRKDLLEQVEKANSSLDEVSKRICQVQNHKWTDWEKEIETDSSDPWYPPVKSITWHRKCVICGRKQWTDIDPCYDRRRLR